MRSIIAVVVLSFALAGCVESQSSVGIGAEPAHNDCWFFCSNDEATHVHFDFFPLVLALGLLAVALIVIAAVSGGRGEGQQQQQQIVIQVPEQRR